MREVENPMVIDSLWDELDQIDMEQDEDEAFYISADEEYEESVLDGMFYQFSREQDGYHF